MKKDFLRYFTYFVYAVVFFLFTAAYNFPYNRLKGYVEYTAEHSYGIDIKMDKISYLFPFGVKLTNVKIKPKHSTKKFDCLYVSCSLNPLSILSSNKKLKFLIETKRQSLLKGNVFFDGKTKYINKFRLSVKNFDMRDLKEFASLNMMFFDLSGRVKGSIVFENKTDKLKEFGGDLLFDLNDINFLPRIPFGKFKDLNDISLKGKIEIQNYLVKIKQIDIKQQFLHMDINGTFKINTVNFDNSIISIAMKIKADPSIVDKRLMPKKVLNKIMLHQKFDIKLRGKLKNPSVFLP